MLPTPLRPSLVTLPNEVVNLIIKENVNFKINSQDFDFEARRRTELVSYAQLSTIWRYEAQLELFHRPEILGLEGVERLVTCLESAEGRLDGFAQELSLKGGNYGESEDLSKLLIRVQGVKELEMTQLEVNAELISLLPILNRLHLTHVTIHPSESSSTPFHQLTHLHLFNCRFSPAALRLFTHESFPSLHSLKLFNVTTLVGFMLPALGAQIINLSLSTLDLSTILYGNLLSCLTNLETIEFVNTKVAKVHAVLLQLPRALKNLRIVTNAEMDWKTFTELLNDDDLVSISALKTIWMGENTADAVGMEELEENLMKKGINLERSNGRDIEFVDWLRKLEERRIKLEQQQFSSTY